MRVSSLAPPSVMYALSQLPAAAGRRVWNGVHERRTWKRVGVSSHRHAAWNDSEREQVLAAVIADAHDFIRLGVGAYEIREFHVRGLALPMSGPQLGERRRLHHGPRALGRGRRSVL